MTSNTALSSCSPARLALNDDEPVMLPPASAADLDKLFAIMTDNTKTARRPDAFNHLVELANSLGVEVVVSQDMKRHPYGWNGAKLRIEPTRRRPEDLAHELAHYIVSNPSRRHLPEFGLGSGFSTDSDVQVKQVAGNRVAWQEEYAACILAAVLLAKVGLPNRTESEYVNFTDSFEEEVSWCDNDVEAESAEILPYLKAWGILDDDLAWTGKSRRCRHDPMGKLLADRIANSARRRAA